MFVPFCFSVVVSQLGRHPALADIGHVQVLWRSVVVPLAVAACSLYEQSEFPDAAVQITPPPHYRIWWDVVQSCSGFVLPFEAVTWFTVPPGGLSYRGKSAAGVWFNESNRIVLSQAWQHVGSLVRHEILHALLGVGSHPAEFFERRCADLVACSGECALGVGILPDAIELSADELQVEVNVFPGAPSISLHDGLATIVVHVRNPLDSNAFVPAWQFTTATCPIGYFLVSASRPDRHDAGCSYLDYEIVDQRVYFRPGERRRLVFEVDLKFPDSGGSFEAEFINVSAVVMDRLQWPTAIRIRR